MRPHTIALTTLATLGPAGGRSRCRSAHRATPCWRGRCGTAGRTGSGPHRDPRPATGAGETTVTSLSRFACVELRDGAVAAVGGGRGTRLRGPGSQRVGRLSAPRGSPARRVQHPAGRAAPAPGRPLDSRTWSVPQTTPRRACSSCARTRAHDGAGRSVVGRARAAGPRTGRPARRAGARHQRAARPRATFARASPAPAVVDRGRVRVPR